MLIRILARNTESVKVLTENNMLFGTSDSIDTYKIIESLRNRAGPSPVTSLSKQFLTDFHFELRPGSYVVIAGGCATNGSIYLDYRKLAIFPDATGGYSLGPSDKIVTSISCSELTVLFGTG